MFKTTLKYMWNLSRGKEDYFDSLGEGDRIYELKMAGLALLFTVTGLIINTVASHYAQYGFLLSTDAQLAQLSASYNPFPYLSIGVWIASYFVLLFLFAILMSVSALILGARNLRNFISASLALVLSSFLFALLSFTQVLFYLSLFVSYSSIIYTLWPIFVVILWMRIYYKIGKRVFDMTPKRSATLVFVISALFLELIILAFLYGPVNVL